jgi:hypothetical protein
MVYYRKGEVGTVVTIWVHIAEFRVTASWRTSWLSLMESGQGGCSWRGTHGASEARINGAVRLQSECRLNWFLDHCWNVLGPFRVAWAFVWVSALLSLFVGLLVRNPDGAYKSADQSQTSRSPLFQERSKEKDRHNSALTLCMCAIFKNH